MILRRESFRSSSLLLLFLLAGWIGACGSSDPARPTDAGDASSPKRDTSQPTDAGVGENTPPENSEASLLLGKDRGKIFDRLVQAIDGLQVVSEAGLKRLSTTWAETLAVSRARFVSATTIPDVYYALSSLQRSYHDVHSRLELAAPDGSGALSYPEDPPVALPFTLRPEYNQGPGNPVEYVVASIENSGLPLAPGYRLEAVDGKPVAEVEKSLLEWVRGSSPEAWQQSVAQWLTFRWADELPAPKPGAQVHYRFIDPQTKAAHELDLTWQKVTGGSGLSDPCIAGNDTIPPSEDFQGLTLEYLGINFCIYSTGDNSTKIVRWFSFFYEFSDFCDNDPGLQEWAPALRERMKHMSYSISDKDLPFEPGEGLPDGYLDSTALSLIDLDKMLTYLDSKGTTRIVFDMRDNTGGNFTPSWVTPFAHAPFKQPALEVRYRAGLKAKPDLLDQAEAGPQAGMAKQYLLDHPTADKSPRYPFICQSQSCDPSEVTVQPAPQPFNAQVVLLTGPDCISSCDTFVNTMKDNGLAKLAGMPPRAGDAPVRVPLSLLLEDGKTSVTFVLTVGVDYSPEGRVLDGNPPPIDFPVYPSISTRGRYLDAVLKAIQWE